MEIDLLRRIVPIGLLAILLWAAYDFLMDVLDRKRYIAREPRCSIRKYVIAFLFLFFLMAFLEAVARPHYPAAAGLLIVLVGSVSIGVLMRRRKRAA